MAFSRFQFTLEHNLQHVAAKANKQQYFLPSKR